MSQRAHIGPPAANCSRGHAHYDCVQSVKPASPFQLRRRRRELKVATKLLPWSLPARKRQDRDYVRTVERAPPPH